MSRRATIALALAFFALAVLGGLWLRSHTGAPPGAPCDADGDCAAGVCLESHRGRTCTTTCESDADCDPTLVCREADVEAHGAPTGDRPRLCAPPKPTLQSPF